MPSTSSLLSNELLLAQNVQPKAATGVGGTPGVAQDGAPAGAAPAASPSSAISSFLPILMMLVVLVPFLLMSGRQKKKEAQARAELKKGDRVMTNAGLLGELVEVDDRIAKVKVSPSVTLQFLASSISPYAEPEKGATKELKEAKVVSDKK